MKKILKIAAICFSIFILFALGVACGVKYMTNAFLIMNASQARYHSATIKEHDTGPSMSIKMYESSLWQWIVKLYEMEKSMWATPNQRKAARREVDEIICYFATHGTDYVEKMVQSVGQDASFRSSISDPDEEDVADLLDEKLGYLLEEFKNINEAALLIYRTRLQDREQSTDGKKGAEVNVVP